MRQSVKELIKYGIVGVIGLGVEWGVFFLFRDVFHLHYMIGHVVGCICAMFNNFLLNSYFTFKATDKIWSRGISFFTIATVGLIASIFILPSLVRIINVALIDTQLLDISQKVIQNVAKLTTTVIIAFAQFVLNKFFTFKKKVVSQ